MKVFDTEYVKNNLSLLIETVLDGQPFVIAKDGKPLVKVVALDNADAKPQKRIGAMKGQFGQISLEEFNEIAQDEIAEMSGIDD